MSEEQENTGGSLKNILLGLVSTITLGVGTWVTTQLTGGDDAEKTEVAAPAPVININNSNQQTQQQSAGKTVIIKEKAVPAQQTQQTQQPVKPVVSKKEKEEEQAQW
jgi:hypothetical protein